MAKATNSSGRKTARALVQELSEEVASSTSPCDSRLADLVELLAQEDGASESTIQALDKTLRHWNRLARKAGSNDDWKRLIDICSETSKRWKAKPAKLASGEQVVEVEHDNEPGLPHTVAQYRKRLVKFKADIYKDPPVLPPPAIDVESKRQSPPKRNKDGELQFTATDPLVKKLLSDFKPNRTPEEILRAGSFGGTYFRSISSSVTNTKYIASQALQDTLPKEWISRLDRATLLTSSTYRPQVNKYGVKCGGSLGMWESSGWIADIDPYGWFQWYCRFYQGRRCSDDSRQIGRWLRSAGPKGRFRSQLCNKILAAGGETAVNNTSISPVIRQTLLHWGIEITPQILCRHAKRTGRR